MAYTKNATVDSWDTAKQLEYYKANPAEAQQEIARANSVGGSAAANWASQLQGGIPAPAASKPTTNNGTPYSSGSGYNYGSSYTQSNTPSPAAVYAPAPTYQTSAPSYSAPTHNTPAPAATSYTGASSVIGNVSGSSDLGKSYQSIYDSTRTPSTANSQLNTWADNKGNVYDTTKMTPQQIFALSLFKDGNQNASAILKGMGLDMNGNPTSPATTYTNSGNGNSNGPAITAAASQSHTTNYGNASPSNQFTPDQQSAQAWINNAASGQGGMDSYIKSQQAKYDYATRSGDQEMLNNLNKDMQRVGYSLNQGAPASGGGQAQPTNTGTTNTGGAPSGSNGAMGGGGGYSPSGAGGYGSSGTGGAIGTDIMNGIMQQIQAITQGLNSSQQANGTQVAQNNAQVTEQIAKMVKQKALDLDNAVSFQNRRGGFYSGGIDTQKSAIENGYQEATGGLNRDVAARNDAIWSNNAMLAKQAADKIAMLQQQAPDQIRAAVSAAAAKQHEDDIKMAGITGYYQDTAQVAAVRQKMAQNSADYALASPSRQKELHDENMRLAASIGGVDATGNGDYEFGQGVRTLEGRKSDYNEYKDGRDFEYKQYRDQISDAQYKQKFDEDNRRYGLDYALKQAVEAGKLQISQMNAETSRMNAGTSANNASVTQQRYNDQQSSKGFEGTVMDELGQLDPSDYEGWLTKNRGEIVRQLGTDGYDRIKKSVTTQTQQQGKVEDDLRKQAINLAKNDPNWYNEADREGLIQEYMGYLK